LLSFLSCVGVYHACILSLSIAVKIYCLQVHFIAVYILIG
jgi:hypothetical protein